MKQSHYPTGWNEERVRKVLQHYERQTEDEAVAEDEAAFRRRDQTVMVVPKRLVPTITRLIAKAGQRDQSSIRQPNKRAAPHRGPVADRNEAKKSRVGRSRCAER